MHKRPKSLEWYQTGVEEIPTPACAVLPKVVWAGRSSIDEFPI